MTTLGNGETSLQPHSDPLRKVAAATGVPYQVLRRNGAETALLQYGGVEKKCRRGHPGPLPRPLPLSLLRLTAWALPLVVV